MTPLRPSPLLLASFVVWGLVIFVGITVLPRGQGGPDVDVADESPKLVGTWTKDGNTVTFTANKTVSAEVRLLDDTTLTKVATYAFDGTTLTVFDDERRKDGTRYRVDLVSDSSTLLGNAGNQYGFFEGLKIYGKPGMMGRWEKEGATEGDASKLVGAWQGAGGKTAGHVVQFTKAGKVEFSRPHWGDEGQTETALGSYSFKKRGLLEMKEAGQFGEKSQIEVEFVSEDEILLVNHGNQQRGFGTLAGRYRRVKR